MKTKTINKSNKTINKIRSAKRLHGLDFSILDHILEHLVNDAMDMLINRTDADMNDEDIVKAIDFKARKLARFALIRHINRIV